MAAATQLDGSSTALADDAPSDDAATGQYQPSHGQRIAAGVSQSVLGPLNITRGISGLGFVVASRVLGGVYRAVQIVISRIGGSTTGRGDADPRRAAFPEVANSSNSRFKRPLVVSLIVAAVLAVGGVAFKLLRTPSTPPVAPAPPRLAPASGATGDSAPDATHNGVSADAETTQFTAVAIGDDPRKRGE